VSPGRWLAAGVAAAALIVVLAIALDLGPFEEGELSESEFLARGDEICREAHEEFESAQEQSPNTAGEAADLTGDLIAISEGELERIRELSTPASLEDPLERYLAAREEGIKQLRKGLAAAEKEDAFAYADAQAEVAADQVHRLQLARDVGFSECSRVLFGRDRLASDAEPPVNAGLNAPPTVSNPPPGTP
jgi:hypothetical protein